MSQFVVCMLPLKILVWGGAQVYRTFAYSLDTKVTVHLKVLEFKYLNSFLYDFFGCINTWDKFSGLSISERA